MAQHREAGEIARKEQELIERLDKVLRSVKEVSEVEDRFFRNARNGEHLNKLSRNIDDFRLYLEDDIQPELEDIDGEVEELRQEVASQGSRDLKEVFNRIEKALGLMEKEETRLLKILEGGEEALEEQDISPREIAGRLDDFERSEESQVLDEIRTELAYSRNKLGQIAEA